VKTNTVIYLSHHYIGICSWFPCESGCDSYLLL